MCKTGVNWDVLHPGAKAARAAAAPEEPTTKRPKRADSGEGREPNAQPPESLAPADADAESLARADAAAQLPEYLKGGAPDAEGRRGVTGSTGSETGAEDA